jgi:NAD(P)-dependent dehydrogenase (short-subunit alcohol dehydrogenase family)
MKIEGNTFLVTGGGSGLGAASAEALAERGARVVVADISGEAARAQADKLGADARAVACDVADERAVMSAIAAVSETFAWLHGVVHCAGVGAARKVVSPSGPHALDLFESVLRINLTGTFNVMRLAADAMRRQEPSASGERGVIINTASVAAFDGQLGQVAYAASKGGVVSMTLPAARELSRYGIRVVTIAPGVFDTPMLAMLPESTRQALAAQVPFPQRLGRPDEFASLARHIIENEMINGETIRLDGALRMSAK